MSIRQLRTGIRSWIESTVRVDAWDLDVPANVPTIINEQRYPSNCAVELPIKDFGVRKANGYLEASGRFMYGILYRYTARAAKEQLPVKLVENLIHYLAEQAVAYPQTLFDDIVTLDIDSIANPVSIARIEGEDKDWLLIGRIELNIEFVSNAEADFGSLQPGTDSEEPFTPTSIQVGLNRSYYPVNPIDPGSYTLDRLLNISLEQ
ncbi:hypothetical protein IQ268_08900 [Oculatella sp. LEGE 06141]|uniref:hypothetical protein n=1 Tax=Oculatella sp. LEGE 06141 TaxID=1828648 RepID=UPI001882554D|nr:hypothetical protein [Oculatella sp. LEGE 06141]MBE9178676.1 hypothetical protein [Oculatella sp. LEGE 06141]